MNRNKPFVYSVAFLSLTIPSQGRFIYGFVLVLEMLLLEIFGTLINAAVSKLKFDEIRSYFVMSVMICVTIFFRQLLAILYPEIALTLGFILYFPTVSSFILYYMFSGIEQPLAKRLSENLKNTFKFSVAILLFFLFRDIAGFGTFTFFGKNHRILEVVLLNPDRIGIFMFFASIPGAIILVGTMIYLYILFKNQVLYHIKKQNKNADKAENNSEAGEAKK